MPKSRGFLPPGWKKKWKKWNQQRPWIPGRTGEWPESPKRDERKVWSTNMRRRKSGFRQKPWNKVTRMEKFWSSNKAPSNDPANVIAIGEAGPGSVPPYNHTAKYVAAFFGDQIASDPASGVSLRSQEHAKIHRFQGDLWCWLDPMTSIDLSLSYNDGADGGNHMPGNLGMLFYAWLKLKGDSNTPGIVGIATLQDADDYNPGILDDWAGMAQRDDLLRFGAMPVWGATPHMRGLIQQEKAIVAGTASVPTQARAAYETFAAGVSNPGQYNAPYVAKIPLPRIPKAGLNLKKGEALVCVASVMAGGPTDYNSGSLDDTTVVRPVIVMNNIRALCSV